MLTYLKFLLKSTNHHGVHSPFVFDYLTKCLYKSPRNSRDRLNNVVAKSIPYFNCETAWIEDNSLKGLFPQLTYGQYPLDILILQNFNLNTLLELHIKNRIHNKTLIIVQHLEKHQKEWQKAVTHTKITVSMDCFVLGILFIRKEQAKEHFTIRL